MKHYMFRLSFSVEVETNFSEDEVDLSQDGKVLLKANARQRLKSQVEDCLEGMAVLEFSLDGYEYSHDEDDGDGEPGRAF